MRIEPEVTIQNVVASARFKHRIDLKAIAMAFPTVDYKPEVFQASHSNSRSRRAAASSLTREKWFALERKV